MSKENKLIEYFSSFTNLSLPYVNEIKNITSTRHLAKNTVYCEKNIRPKSLGFLSQGLMRIYDIDSSGQEWNKVFLSPPSLVIGNPSIQDKSLHFIETITACEIIEIPITSLITALNNYPEAKEIQTKLLLQLFEKKSKREYDFMSLTAKQRYLNFLKTDKNIMEQLPQFHIASYLGITPTQLSRINTSIRNQHM